MSVAVAGPPSFVTCFALIGAEGFDAEEGEAVADTLGRLIDEPRFKLIIIPERFAKETLTVQELVMKRGASRRYSPSFRTSPWRHARARPEWISR